MSGGRLQWHEWSFLGGDVSSARPAESAICVITRFALRSPLLLPLVYLDYRRILRDARHIDGLLRAAFLIETPSRCVSLSIWRNWEALGRFGTEVHEHAASARRLFGRMRMNDNGKPELWSTKWSLIEVSSNINWEPNGGVRRPPGVQKVPD